MSDSSDGREQLNDTRDRVSARVVGRQRELTLVLAAVAAGRDILLEGPPGTSKTTLLKAITAEWDIPLVFVEGNADLTPAKLVGHHNPARVLHEDYTAGQLHRRPAAGGDAVGRLPLHRGVQPRARGHPQHPAHRHGRPPDRGAEGRPGPGAPTFRVIASMNPYDNIGTTRLSTSVHDRFCRLSIGYQDERAERDIVALRAPLPDCAPAVYQRLAADAVALTRATRAHEDIRQGSSVRGAIDLTLIAGELLNLDLERTVDSAGPADDSDAERGAPRGDNEKQYRETVYDAMVVALSGRIFLDETVDLTPEQVLQADLGGPLHPRPGRGGPRLKSDRGRLADQPPGQAAPRAIPSRALKPLRRKPKTLTEEPVLLDVSPTAGPGGAVAGERGTRDRSGKPRTATGSGGPATTDEQAELTSGLNEHGDRRPTRRRCAGRARSRRGWRCAGRAGTGRPPRDGGRARQRPVPGRRGRHRPGRDRGQDRGPGRGRGGRHRRAGADRRPRARWCCWSTCPGRCAASGCGPPRRRSARWRPSCRGTTSRWSRSGPTRRCCATWDSGSRPRRWSSRWSAIPARGLTNVAFPLQVAARELARIPARDARVLLLSDCVHNAGPDPRPLAARLPRLDVLLDTTGEQDRWLGGELARLGRGKLRRCRHLP